MAGSLDAGTEVKFLLSVGQGLVEGAEGSVIGGQGAVESQLFIVGLSRESGEFLLQEDVLQPDVGLLPVASGEDRASGTLACRVPGDKQRGKQETSHAGEPGPGAAGGEQQPPLIPGLAEVRAGI